MPARISSRTFFSSFGILRQQQDLDLRLQRLVPRLEVLELLFGERGHLGVAAADQFLRFGELLIDGHELAVLLDERLEFRQRLGVLAILGGIRLDGRIGQQRRPARCSAFQRI